MSIKFISLSILLSFLVQIENTFAQYVFQKTYSTSAYDDFSSMIQTQDGGFAMIGKRLVSAGNNDIWFVKTNSDGNVLYSITYGSTADDVGTSIKQISTGEYLICGYTTTTTAGKELFIAKLDFQGTLLWLKTYGAAMDEQANSLTVNAAGEIVVSGYTTSIGVAFPKGLLIKTDGSGNLIWSRAYTQITTQKFNKVIPTADGGYLAVGSIILFGNTDPDMVVVKTNAAGTMQWCRSYGDMGNEDAFDAVQVGSNYFITGYTTSVGFGSRDVYVIKTDSNGFPVLGYAFGSELSETAFNINQYDANSLVITGYAELTNFSPLIEAGIILKTDLNLNMLAMIKTGKQNSQTRVNASVVTNLGKVALAGHYKDSSSTIFTGFLAQNNLLVNQSCFDSLLVFAAYPYLPAYTSSTSTVLAPVVVQLPVFTSNTISTIETSLCFTTGIASVNRNDFFIAPNPASSQLELNVADNFKKGILVITDLSGRELIRMQLTQPKQQINISNFANGIYAIQLQIDDKIITRKFVKQ